MNKTTNKFSPEVRERAVRMVDEHRADYGSEWAAMTSIAGKIGCTAETLRRWCREEASRRAGPAAQSLGDKDRLKALGRRRNPRRSPACPDCHLYVDILRPVAYR